jgi:hypothetical protein
MSKYTLKSLKEILDDPETDSESGLDMAVFICGELLQEVAQLEAVIESHVTQLGKIRRSLAEAFPCEVGAYDMPLLVDRLIEEREKGAVTMTRNEVLAIIHTVQIAVGTTGEGPVLPLKEHEEREVYAFIERLKARG